MTGGEGRGPDPRSGSPPLNDPQRAAIEHGRGPLMVLAGAGTGKTRVLVHRIARLVETGVPPWAILAVTFTNKAADEMSHRLRGLLGDAADAMWIGTFHAICARILRRHGSLVGLTRGFSILDEDDQVKIVERILGESGLDENLSPRVVMGRIDRIKNRGERDRAGDPGRPGPPPGDPSGSPASPTSIDDAVAAIYPIYQARLARENAVDFSDLLLRTLDLLEIEPAAQILADKFQYVLVDEFQDTNQVQYQLVGGLSRATRNLTVVGDDDQSIYAWRGAEPKNLLDFDLDYPDARVVKLEQNYRSTQTILDAANRVIRRNTARRGKVLWSDRGPGPPVTARRSEDERGEARFVAQSIRGLIDAGSVRPGEIAILYRTNAQSRVLEEHLAAAGVPARVVGGVSFFERREVRDVVAYLRLALCPQMDSALERVINVPPRGLGDKTVDRVRAIARADGISLLEATRAAGSGSGASGIGPGPRGKLRSVVELMDGLRDLIRAGTSVPETIVQIIERSGLRARLESDRSDDATARLDHLADLVTMAIDFRDEVARRSRQGPPGPARRPAELAAGAAAEAPFADPEDAPEEVATVEGFLERAALAAPGDREHAGAPADPGQAVVLTTIHVAKGLEWPVVFVTGLEDGLFPSLRAREDVGEEAAIEEERRLAYVAITRARERLVLSHAMTRRVWGEIRVQQPSRFLDDAIEPTPRRGRTW